MAAQERSTKVMFMEELAEADRSKLFERFGRTYDAESVIYAEGDAADVCFFVEQGRVRLVKHIRGTERSLTILRRHDLFGEDALRSGAHRQATAVALSDVTVLALGRETLVGLIGESPSVALRLLEQLVERIHHAEEQLENAMLGDHASRVVNSLIRLAQGQPAGPHGHVLQVSPLELASRVGLEVDTAKRAVQQLREGGYLQIADERIIVPDLSPLRQLYDLLGRKEEVRGGAA
jgi:CRP/FNR family transcriptional regulator, cyclic AMP receptor protein